jgi:hypothetical protein
MAEGSGYNSVNFALAITPRATFGDPSLNVGHQFDSPVAFIIAPWSTAPFFAKVIASFFLPFARFHLSIPVPWLSLSRLGSRSTRSILVYTRAEQRHEPFDSTPRLVVFLKYHGGWKRLGD